MSVVTQFWVPIGGLLSYCLDLANRKYLYQTLSSQMLQDKLLPDACYELIQQVVSSSQHSKSTLLYIGHCTMTFYVPTIQICLYIYPSKMIYCWYLNIPLPVLLCECLITFTLYNLWCNALFPMFNPSIMEGFTYPSPFHRIINFPET